jgi:hypothetical protein
VKIREIIGVLIFLAACSLALYIMVFDHPSAEGKCPSSLKCDRDGEWMPLEMTYEEDGHVKKRYGHDYFGTQGKEHHQVTLVCK